MTPHHHRQSSRALIAVSFTAALLLLALARQSTRCEPQMTGGAGERPKAKPSKLTAKTSAAAAAAVAAPGGSIPRILHHLWLGDER